MVGVQHHWQITDHSCWQPPFTSIQCSLWRSSGFSVRPGFICHLHFGCSQTCRGTWPWCSPLRRCHPAVWPLLTFQFLWVGVSSSSSYWVNSLVDVLEPALSQHWHDSIHLAWYEAQFCQERYRSALQSTSVPDWTHIHEESRFRHRSRVDHERSYHQTLPVVLLPASPNTHGSALAHIISHPNSGPCLHPHASRLRQQPPLWDKCLPPWPSPIGPKFCCTFDPQNWLQFGMTFIGSQFSFVFNTNLTPSRATSWLAVHRSTWSSSATPWITSQQGATFGHRLRLNS